MINVKGYRVLVKADEIEKVTKGGIVLVQDERLEKTLTQFGTVVDIGETCWIGEAFKNPWCKVGDKIMFSKHSGRFVRETPESEQYLIMNDTDVLAVIGEE